MTLRHSLWHRSSKLSKVDDGDDDDVTCAASREHTPLLIKCPWTPSRKETSIKKTEIVDEDEAATQAEEEAAKVAASLGSGDRDMLSLTLKVARQEGQELDLDEVSG